MSEAEVYAAVLWLALTAYAVLAGADFGGGVWDLFASGPRAADQRRAVAEAMGPVWEANHVWLIFLIVGLYTGFPTAFGMLATKDYRAVTALLAPLAAAVVTTRPDNPHALSAEDLASEVRRYTAHVEAVDDRRAAVTRARQLTGPDDVLLVTGSFYFVGEARAWLLQRRASEPART